MITSQKFLINPSEIVITLKCSKTAACFLYEIIFFCCYTFRKIVINILLRYFIRWKRDPALHECYCNFEITVVRPTKAMFTIFANLYAIQECASQYILVRRYSKIAYAEIIRASNSFRYTYINSQSQKPISHSMLVEHYADTAYALPA